MRRWFFIIGSLIATSSLFFWANTHLKMIDMSSLRVTVGLSLSLDSVQVSKGFYSINRTNDLELFNNDYDRLIFHGHQVGGLDTDYGENDFLITYGDRYYFQFRHFITNSNDQHDYKLVIDRRGDSLYLSVDIDGPEAMRFTRPMDRISDAVQQRCNGPIDSTKFIYNMVELE